MTGEKKPESLAGRHKRWMERQVCTFMYKDNVISTPETIGDEAVESFQLNLNHLSKLAKKHIAIDASKTEKVEKIIPILIMVMQANNPAEDRKRVYFRNPSEQMLEVLEKTGLDQFMESPPK